MKRKKQRSEKRAGKPGVMAFLVRLVVLAVVAYGAWHVFCRYYPSVIRRLSGTVSAEIVDNEYRFGDVNSTHLTAAQKNGIKPVSSRDELKTDKLVKIESCDEYIPQFGITECLIQYKCSVHTPPSHAIRSG